MLERTIRTYLNTRIEEGFTFLTEFRLMRMILVMTMMFRTIPKTASPPEEFFIKTIYYIVGQVGVDKKWRKVQRKV